jgi:hypothetical protein
MKRLKFGKFIVDIQKVERPGMFTMVKELQEFGKGVSDDFDKLPKFDWGKATWAETRSYELTINDLYDKYILGKR